MDKKQKKFEQELAEAYLQGRRDAQVECYGLVMDLHKEIVTLRKMVGGNGKRNKTTVSKSKS